MDLGTKDFPAFHQAIHGVAPFAWQQRLLEQIVARAEWPRVLDLPTGAGKTTCIDVALFALALDSTMPASKRWCPRRIALVVDRRVIVDQAAQRGRKLARALTEANTPEVQEVARRLRSLAPEASQAVDVFTLRGGIPKDDGWARRPDQPLIIASTIDQVGSRLLIQGYGVSRSMRPVHAGLLANDTLLLLDEVHLSQPFAETLEQLERLRTRFGAQTPRRFAFAFLSATPASTATEPFRLSEDERALDTALGPRLHVSKPARLVKISERAALVETCRNAAEDLLARHDTIAVVVNRVNAAAAVAAEIRKLVDGRAHVALLTGRMRPLDRDRALGSIATRISAGRDRTRVDHKLIVVATQTIEAGADFDFDAIVTECASLDALRQRFGRVDRLGKYAASEGIIVAVGGEKSDPVYGEAAGATAKWVEKNAKGKPKQIDFGVERLPLIDPAELASLVASKSSAPLLLPAYLDLWTQTSPEPATVPDVSLWLHGPQTLPPDVQVIWRADLTEEELRRASRKREADDDSPNDEVLAGIVARVAAVRPSSLEALPIPFVAAKRWLEEGEDVGIADVEGAHDDQTSPTPNRWGVALRWDGDRSRVVTARELRPGDTLIVPSERGGIRDGSFSVDGNDPVDDLAEEASLLSRGRALLRLNREILGAHGFDDVDPEDVEGVRAAALGMANECSGWKRLWLDAIGRGRKQFAVTAEDEIRIVLEGKRISPQTIRKVMAVAEGVEDGVPVSTDPETSPFIGCRVTLSDHSNNVARWARRFAESLGLAPGLMDDLVAAAALHDIGKADPRFQLMLRGGNEIDYLKDAELLAKSGMSPESRAEQERARKVSGYPRGARHEVQSVAMLEQAKATFSPRVQDLDLVFHLVGSHHGYCRPLAPIFQDDLLVEVCVHAHSVEGRYSLDLTASSDHRHYRLDSPVADRFWRVVNRYGWLEICWLEALLRLADHRASEEEQERGA